MICVVACLYGLMYGIHHVYISVLYAERPVQGAAFMFRA